MYQQNFQMMQNQGNQMRQNQNNFNANNSNMNLNNNIGNQNNINFQNIQNNQNNFNQNNQIFGNQQRMFNNLMGNCGNTNQFQQNRNNGNNNFSNNNNQMMGNNNNFISQNNNWNNFNNFSYNNQFQNGQNNRFRDQQNIQNQQQFQNIQKPRKNISNLNNDSIQNNISEDIASIKQRNNELEKMLDEEKIKNFLLISENENLKQKITELNNKIKIINRCEEFRKLIVNRKNRKIESLENQIKNKNSELQKYKESKDNQDEDIFNSIKPGEKILAINFVSMGSNDINNYNQICKNTELFVRVEERLYKDFPQFKNYETYFEVNGKRIKRFKTLNENKIKKNDVICIFTIEED